MIASSNRKDPLVLPQDNVTEVAVTTPCKDTKPERQFPPLTSVTSPNVDTAAAAHYLNRRPQTLRGWASAGDGPLRPRRVNGRLAWSVADIRAAVGVAR